MLDVTACSICSPYCHQLVHRIVDHRSHPNPSVLNIILIFLRISWLWNKFLHRCAGLWLNGNSVHRTQVSEILLRHCTMCLKKSQSKAQSSVCGLSWWYNNIIINRRVVVRQYSICCQTKHSPASQAIDNALKWGSSQLLNVANRMVVSRTKHVLVRQVLLPCLCLLPVRISHTQSISDQPQLIAAVWWLFALAYWVVGNYR